MAIAAATAVLSAATAGGAIESMATTVAAAANCKFEREWLAIGRYLKAGCAPRMATARIFLRKLNK